jgi:hypothetical protein
MTDQWVPAPPQPPPPDPPPGLPPANSWSRVTPCAAADAPSIADGVIITGRPAVVSAMPWQITVNDGQNPPNFSIDHFDANGALLEHPISIAGTNGDVTLTHDPTQPLGVATKQYVDNTGLREAPMDNQTYGRDNGTWVVLPGSYMPEAPNTSQRYGRFNSVWQLDAIQTDAPNDGTAYARQSGAWTAAVTGGPYLPLTGGTISGSLTVNTILTVNGPNSMVLNAPGGQQRAILGQTSTLTRWQLQLGDQTAEGLGNAGSNFSLTAYSNTAGFLGNWLTIARADGSATFNGSGVTIAGGLAVNGLLALASVSNLAIYGGSAGQVLSTNGSGVLSWATRLSDAPSDGQFYTRQNAAWAVAPGGMTDAPNDGTAYARKSAGWAHLTHTDITDWTASLAPYALSTAVPAASSTLPLADGVAAIGTSTAYARADHVHPAPAADPYSHDNRVINGDMRIDQRNNGALQTTAGYCVDRWQVSINPVNHLTVQRLGPAPALFALTGFPYYLSIVSTSAYLAAPADVFSLFQPIEADAVSDFQFGTANAKPVTLSFWVNSSLMTGTFSGRLGSSVGTRTYPFTFDISFTNTWIKVVITVPGDTSGTWVTSGNGVGIYVQFDLGCGSNWRGPANAWSSTNYIGVTGAISIVNTINAAFNITGVKLEIGSVATPYNRQSLAKSQSDCERYYEIWVAPGIFGLVDSTGATRFNIPFRTLKRAAPTVTIVGTPSNPTLGGAFAAGFNASTVAGVNISTWTASAEL